MNAALFVMMISLSLGAYFFGNFSTLYGIVPDGGSILNAWVKGILLGASAWILINKLRDYITINSSIKLIVVFVAATSGYLYEAGKEQRVGRKILAKNFVPEAADGAWIHYSEKGNWSPNALLIEFTQSEIKQEKDFPTFRKIPYCNILFKGSEEMFKKIPADKLQAAKFYWSQEKTETGVLYKVVGMLPENINWFFQSLEEKQSALLPSENIENARQLNENSTYIDRSCASRPYTYKKKLFSANKTLQSEWYEKEGAERFEETLYDTSGKKLSGQVHSEFVYFVEKNEAFQNGFGKAGMLKCQGFYTYKDGIRHGPYEFYYPGHIAKAFLGQYENGVQVGIQKLYNPNGTLKKTWDVGNSNSGVSDALTLSR